MQLGDDCRLRGFAPPSSVHLGLFVFGEATLTSWRYFQIFARSSGSAGLVPKYLEWAA